MFSKIMHRNGNLESSSSTSRKDKVIRRSMPQFDNHEQPISVTPDLDSSFAATVESSNVYEPVSYNTENGMSNTETSKTPETSSATVATNDKVLLCIIYYYNDHVSTIPILKNCSCMCMCMCVIRAALMMLYQYLSSTTVSG